MSTRRQILAGMALLWAGTRWGAGRAAASPNKPLKLLCGHPPGGQSDAVARLIAPKLSEVLGQSVVIENRSGAAGTIAAMQVAKAAPDGHTLLICSSTSLALARIMVADLPYDPVRDFAMIARLASIPTVLAIGNWIPATTAPELVAYARARPGELTAGSSGNGSSSGFSLELLKAATGVDILQVPYGGLAPAVTALLSRQVDMAFAEFTLVSAHAKSGKLRLLGTPATSRFAAAPELLTLREQGLQDVVLDAWTGVVAPAGLPGETLANLANALSEVVRMPDLRQRLLDAGFEAIEDTPAQFAASVKADIRRFAAVAARLGIGPANAGAGGTLGGS
jgi:tripartite-type tricarboxylate transporter receptor subunit TctC